MQGGFIEGFKENLKALKQELKGADVYSTPVRFQNSNIYSKDVSFDNDIKNKDFIIQSQVYSKTFGIKSNIYSLNKTSFNGNARSFNLGIKTFVKNHEFEKPQTFTKTKDLEKFITVTKAKEIELSKKSKIKEVDIDKFKVKAFEGTDKIRKIPAIVEGRRFLSNKELIDLAIKVKTERKDLDFTKYNFKVVFENLPVDLIDDFQYLADNAQLKLYYKKYNRQESKRNSLVILVKKNSLITEKIFV